MTRNSLKKTAVAIGILVFAAIAAVQAQDSKPFIGAWKGTLSIAGQELEIGLNFTLDETGKKLSGDFTQAGYAGTFAVTKQ
jgi:hypothetical protein